MRRTPLLPSLPVPLLPGVVAPDRVQSIVYIELKSVLMLIIYDELFEIELFLTFKLCTYA